MMPISIATSKEIAIPKGVWPPSLPTFLEGRCGLHLQNNGGTCKYI
jgi:hypothetical protein